MCVYVSHCLTAHSQWSCESLTLWFSSQSLSLLATAAHITARVWIIWVEERKGKKRGCGQCKKSFEPRSVKTRGWWNNHLLSVVKTVNFSDLLTVSGSLMKSEPGRKSMSVLTCIISANYAKNIHKNHLVLKCVEAYVQLHLTIATISHSYELISSNMSSYLAIATIINISQYGFISQNCNSHNFELIFSNMALYLRIVTPSWLWLNNSQYLTTVTISHYYELISHNIAHNCNNCGLISHNTTLYFYCDDTVYPWQPILLY